MVKAKLKSKAKSRRNPIDDEPAISEKSLSALFQKDPKKLTKADRTRMIKAFREQRIKWNLEEKDAKNKGKKPKHSTGMDVSDIEDLLGNLDEAVAGAGK